MKPVAAAKEPAVLIPLVVVLVEVKPALARVLVEIRHPAVAVRVNPDRTNMPTIIQSTTR